jgi:ABC-type Fe3+-siderophore transport system permease subunit
LNAQGDTLERTLAGIEARVLGEVWMGRRQTCGYGLLTGSLLGATGMWCWKTIAAAESTQWSGRIPVITMIVLAASGLASTIALSTRTFRGCCAAAYCCGLAAVGGIGAFWWLRTGRVGVTSGWLIIADVVGVLLTMCWLAVVVRPIERSQPEMRLRRNQR